MGWKGGSPDAFNARETFEPAVEGQNAIDALGFHHRGMNGVARRKQRLAENNLLGSLGVLKLDAEGLVDDAQQSVERGLNGVLPLDGEIAVENLLEHFRICHEASPLRDTSLEESLRLNLVGVWCPYEVHRNIRVDEDQG